MIMKRCYRILCVTLLWLSLGFSSLWGQDEVTYGFIQDPSDPLMITAVAYPNYSSDNVTISTAVFSFLLPAGTVTDPSIPPLQVATGGSFNNINGIWFAQLVQPATYTFIGADPTELLGNDVYQVALQNSPSFSAFNPIVAGTPIELFSFRLPSDCMSGNVEVLTNDGAVQQSIFMNLGSNFNNQMSMSIDDDPAVDIYAGNDPASFSLPCALDDVPTAVDDAETTDENTPVNVAVLLNDDFGNNGPSTGTITITVQPTNGTATVNDGGTPDDPSDDTIDYTPNNGYTGTDVLTYQICDSDGDCDDALVTITILDALIGVAKDASVPTDNLNGTFTTTITMTVENLGDVVLGDIQVEDDLSAFGTHVSLIDLDMAGEYTVSGLNIGTNSADALSPNLLFDGAGDTELLDVPAGGTLAVGEIVTISFDLTFIPANDSYTNVAVASGDVPANDDPNGSDDTDPDDTTDDSTDGTNPDPNDDDNPNEDTPTPIDPNDLPIANDDSETTDENTPVNVPVLVDDDFGSDGPSTGTITVTTQPPNGTAVVNDGGTPNDPTDDTIDYTPNNGYSGTDVFTYEICDSDGECDPADVTITILDANIGLAKEATTPTDNLDGTFTTTITMTVENLGDVVLGDIQVEDNLSAFGAYVTPGNLDVAGEYTVGNLTIGMNSADALSTNAAFDGAGDIELLDVSAGGTLAVGETVTISFDLTFIPANDTYTNVAVASGDVPANDDPNGSDDNDPDDTTDNSTDGPNPDPNNDDNPDEDTPTLIDPNDLPVAEDDSETTDENTPVNVPVLVNDDFGSDGPSIGTITLTSPPSNGTAVVNDGGTPNDPTDDTFDYTPNNGYTGTDVFSYEICDSDGDCDPADVTITILDANIGIAKAATTPLDNMDGTFTTTITMTVENLGDVVLGDIQVEDNLSAFGAPVAPGDLDAAGEYTVSNLTIGMNSADALSPNGAFDGAGDVELLDVPAGGTLAVGETVTISFDLTFYPSQADYTNVAVASGDVPANDDPNGSDDTDPDDTTDDSTDGTNPDPNNDDNPDENTPTPIDPNDLPVAEDDSETTDENTPVNVAVLVNDDFGIDGPSTGTITVTSQPSNGTAVVNDGGTPNDPTDDTIDYTPNNGYAGTDVFTYEICDSDGECDPADVTITILDAEIGVAKEASAPVLNVDGSYTTTFTIIAENLGDVVLGDIQIEDDLSAFGTSVLLADLDAAGEYTVSGLSIDVNSADVLSPNSSFDGAGDVELLDVPAGGTLAVGETVTISFDLTFFPAQSSYTNVAVASGDVPARDDPNGSDDTDPDDSSDNSTDGPDPDPNNDGTPDESVPTIINPNDTPVANDDAETTDENTPVNVPVLVNDDFGNDGPSTGTITVTAQPSNGTATVNDGGTPNDPTDDTIDYTPNNGYTGTDVFTYEICDADGECDPADVTITILDALIGVAKDATTPVDNMNGTFTTTITMTVENLGDVVLGDVQVEDDLSAFGAYAAPGSVDMAGEYTITNLTIDINSSNALSPNGSFDGAGDVELLDVSAGGTLGVGETVVISFDLIFDPASDDYTNVAVASGDVPANDDPNGSDDTDPDDTTDDSTDGTNPDPNNDDNPDEDTPTPIDPDDVPVAINDAATTDQNTPINIDPLVNDDFGGDGPSTGTITILAGPINGTGTVNDGGTPNDPTDDTFDYTPNPGFAGNDIITYQICDSDGDCDVASVNITVLEALIGIAKDASTPVDNLDGTFTTTITMTVENLGGTILGDVQVEDDLSAFGTNVELADVDVPGEYSVDNLSIDINSTDVLSPNAGFDGAGDIELLDVSAGGTLGVGETVVITFDLTLYPAQDEYTNVAVATADTPANDDPTGSDDTDPDDTTDDSTDGTDPDPNNNGDPDENTPTPIDPNDVPVANDDAATTDQDVPVNIDPLVNDDFGSDGPSTGTITILAGPINGTGVLNDGGTPNDPTDDTIDYTPNPGFFGTDVITYEICDSDGDCDQAVINITITATAVKLLAKVRLQGALLGSPDGMMRDDLRSRGFIPTVEPYTELEFEHLGPGGTEVITDPGTVFADNGNNSIVDWVFVELRSDVDPAMVLATRSGLVQKDGDIVDLDGVSPLCFEQVQPGSFYVAVRHRNHIGTMTASAIPLTAVGTVVDFTDLNTPLWNNTANFDGVEQITVDGAYALWAGNTSVDRKVVFAGQDNDKDPIFNEIDQAEANILNLQTFIFPGYHPGDVNLNGDSIYAGQNNDVDPIFNNVDGHPVNILKLQTFVIPEQLAGN
jgi:hypothetical protein